MSNGGLITDYINVGSGAPSAPSVPGGESALYLRTSNNHLYAWDGSSWQDITGSGGGGSSVLLNYRLASDINGTSIGASTWTNFDSSHSFTKLSGSTNIMICVLGYVVALGSAGDEIASRLVVDSTNYAVGGDSIANSSHVPNYLAGAGSLILTGLASGSHTVQLQLFSQNASTAYCRPSSRNYESLAISVVEF